MALSKSNYPKNSWELLMFEFEPAMEMFFIAVKARDLIYGEIFYFI